MAQLPKISTVTHDDRIRLRNASAHGLPDHPTARGMKPADIKRMLADPVVGESDSAIAYLIRLTSELFYYDAALKGILNELRGDVNQVNENTDLMWGDGDTGSSIRSVAENVADSRLSAHNAGTDAHPDLRASIAYVRSLLNSLATHFNAMADSDDETLDQLSEMVAYIKANRGLIEAVTTAKVSVADIVDSLYSSEANKPLSAAQGAELRRLLELLDDTKLDTTQLPDAINTALHNAKESGAFGSDPAWTVRAAGEVVVPTTAWTEDENATVVLQGIEKGDLVLLFPSNELTRLICEKCHVHVSSSANETDDTVLLFRCRFAGQTLELPPTAMTFGFRVLACHDPLMCASAVIVGVNYDEVNHVAIEELGTRIDNLQSLLAGGEDGGKSIRSVAEEVTDDHDASPLAHADIRELIETLTANVYDKTAVDRLVSLIPKLTIEPVEALPELADASLTAFYLVPSGESESDVYTEWFCVEKDGVRSWERLGTQKMDLSGYATTAAMNTAIANAIADALVGYVTGVEVDGKISKALSDYVDASALQTALTEALKSYAKTTAIPTKLAQLEADAAHRTVTDDEKAAWNSKAAGDHTHDGLYQPKGNYQPAGNYAAEGHKHDDLYMKKGETASGVPDYVVAEAERVADVVLSRSGACVLRFIAFADAHQQDGNKQIDEGNRDAGYGMRELLRMIGMDFVSFLGDAAWGSTTDTVAEVMEQVKSFNRHFGDALKGERQIRLEGNHDDGNYSLEAYPDTPKLTSAALHGLFYGYNRGMVTDPEHPLDGYGYRDFDAQKVRMIALNTEQGDGDGGVVEGYQLKWFAETALDMSGKEDWTVITLAHHPLDWGSATLFKDCVRIVDAFMSGAAFNYTTTNGTAISVDYGGKSCQYAGHFHGHTHALSVVKMQRLVVPDEGDYYYEDTDAYEIGIPNTCFLRNNQNATSTNERIKRFSTDVTYNKTEGTAQSTSFSVVTLCPVEKLIYIDNYGAGVDRVVSYGAVLKTYSITRTLTNIYTSSLATTAVESLAHTEVLTPADGYTLDGATVTVTMGGEDITSTAYSGGVVSIASVTGDVVITAIAAEVAVAPAYTNQLPISTDTDGSIYNGTGYKADTYLSAAAEGARPGVVTTGFIPFGTGSSATALGEQVVRFANAELTAISNSRINLYAADKTFITQIIATKLGDGLHIEGVNIPYETDANGYITYVDLTRITYDRAYHANMGETGYIRICGAGIDNGTIITVNEEIT